MRDLGCRAFAFHLAVYFTPIAGMMGGAFHDIEEGLLRDDA